MKSQDITNVYTEPFGDAVGYFGDKPSETRPSPDSQLQLATAMGSEP